MGTLRSSIGLPTHHVAAIDRGDKPAVPAAFTDSDIGASRLKTADDEIDTCADLDCLCAEKNSDPTLAVRAAEHLVQSSSREPKQQRVLLLLSRDLHSGGRDLHSANCESAEECETQSALSGIDPPAKCPTRKPNRHLQVHDRLAVPEDEHMRTYLRRLAAHGAATKGISAYGCQLRATLRAARRLQGSPISLADLFCDATLLGRALVDDISATGTQLSKWTLAQRRSAIRSFANLMRPELLVILGEEPVNVVDCALRLVAERIGGGYRLTGGAPRRRGGTAPSRDEVTAIFQCLGDASGFIGLRNRAFFHILWATGCRVNALRELDGTNCLVLPNGRVRLYLHEKGKAERREVELSGEVAHALLGYTAAFNRLAVARWWQCRVGPGEPGAMWRNDVGRRWSYASVAETLRSGCERAGVPEFSPHALRRAFASDAASLLPRHIVAQAGGWKGRDRLDDHYVQPCETTIWEKLTRLDSDTTLARIETELNDATAVTV